MKNGRYVLLTGILALAAVMHLYGIWWGVSDMERMDLLIGRDGGIEEYVPILQSLHDEIDEMLPSYGRQYSPSYFPDELMTFKTGGREITAAKSIFNSMRSYLIRSYGADEQRAIIALSRIRPWEKKFDPRFYEYGGVYLYPMGLFFYGLSKLNWLILKPDISFYLSNPWEMGRMFVCGRIFGAAGALLSVLVFFLLCGELFTDKRIVCSLTLLYGVAPGIVLWSHYLKPFSYGMLWFLLSLFAAVRFYKTEKSGWLYVAAAVAGLSFGTLLSYGYVYWSVVLFVLFSGRGYKWKLKNLLLTFLIFLSVFLVTNPYTLLSYRGFLQELSYLRGYWHSSMSINLPVCFVGNTLRYGMGTMLWIVALTGTAGSLVYRSGKIDRLFFLLLLPGFLYFAFTTAQWVHYSIFLYPLFIISCGFFLERLDSKKAVTAVLFVAGIYTVLYSGSYVRLLGERNTRTTAGEWVNEEIPRGSSIGLLEAPSPWRTPPFSFPYYKLVLASEPGVISAEKPDYFIVSEYQWLRGPGLSAERELLSGYEVIKKFEKVPSMMGVKFRHGEFIPYDWCHPNPVILIWKRKT